MPVYNITIDDVSPLIQYDGWWTDSSHNDPAYIDYYEQTFHRTETIGASTGLTFNGSAVYLFGAKRSNHGEYTVTLDGQETTGSGYSINALFKQILYSQIGISLWQEHQLFLKNTPSTSSDAFIDLDYVVITAGDGDPSTQSQDVTWDDNMAQYSLGWDTSPNGLEGNYFNSTMHRTGMLNAYATVTFEGNAVGVYGATSTNHGFFSVSLDGSPLIKLNGTIPGDPQTPPRYQNLLYWAGGLTSGQHTVTITNTDTNGLWLDLDKFVVSRWSQSSSETSGSAPSRASNPGLPSSSISSARSVTSTRGLQDSNSSRSPHAATGAIIGLAVAGTVVVALIALGLLFYLLRRQYRHMPSNTPSEPRYNNLLEDGGSTLATITPFTLMRRTSSTPRKRRRPFAQASLAADPRLTGASPTGTPTSPTARRSSRHAPRVDRDPQATATAAAAPLPEPAVEPERILSPVENPHQDFPPPSYQQATAAGSSSRGPLPLPLPVAFLPSCCPPPPVHPRAQLSEP